MDHHPQTMHINPSSQICISTTAPYLLSLLPSLSSRSVLNMAAFKIQHTSFSPLPENFVCNSLIHRKANNFPGAYRFFHMICCPCSLCFCDRPPPLSFTHFILTGFLSFFEEAGPSIPPPRMHISKMPHGRLLYFLQVLLRCHLSLVLSLTTLFPKLTIPVSLGCSIFDP